MITLKFNGQDYSLFIVFDKIRNIFFIKALHNETKRYSFITNLNCIISEFNVGIDDKTFWETQWDLSRNNISSFVKKSVNLLEDKRFLDYLENQLNLDRSLGEWENIGV